VLADEDERVGEQIEGYREAAALQAHHEFVLLQLRALFIEYVHVSSLTEWGGRALRRRREAATAPGVGE
jgi:hypothetical protein